MKGKIISANIFFVFLTTALLLVGYNVEVVTNDTYDHGNVTSKEFFIPIPRGVCLTIGYSLYFTGLSMFCWMSLLCFDLFWTFNHLRTPQEQKKCGSKLVTHF
jgi:hypothetical protein